MSNRDIIGIVGNEFEDLDPKDMAMLTGRGNNDAAPASTPLSLASINFCGESIALSIISVSVVASKALKKC